MPPPPPQPYIYLYSLVWNSTSQWCHNEHSGILNHRLLDCLPTVCLNADQRKYKNSVSLAFVRGMHWWPVDSPHKGPASNIENVSLWWCHHDLRDLNIQWHIYILFDAWYVKKTNYEIYWIMNYQYGFIMKRKLFALESMSKGLKKWYAGIIYDHSVKSCTINQLYIFSLIFQ